MIKSEKELDIHLPVVILELEATVNSSTGYSPHKLLFVCEPTLPIDMLAGAAPIQTWRVPKYV